MEESELNHLEPSKHHWREGHWTIRNKSQPGSMIVACGNVDNRPGDSSPEEPQCGRSLVIAEVVEMLMP